MMTEKKINLLIRITPLKIRSENQKLLECSNSPAPNLPPHTFLLLPCDWTQIVTRFVPGALGVTRHVRETRLSGTSCGFTYESWRVIWFCLFTPGAVNLSHLTLNFNHRSAMTTVSDSLCCCDGVNLSVCVCLTSKSNDAYLCMVYSYFCRRYARHVNNLFFLLCRHLFN